jgi:hypothetical protein
MLNLPWIVIELLNPFAPIFYGVTTWEKAKILLVGAILAPGKRTVSSTLRVMGLSEEAKFAQYHHVLNRAVWSLLEMSKVLLGLVVRTLNGGGPVVLGIDEHIERRRGKKISAKGIYRDAVRSSESHFVKTSGLRWISLMVLSWIPWAQRIWALPVLTALAPSERYHEERGQRHKVVTDWARQMIMQVRRWLPGLKLVFVADGAYAVLDLLHACQSLTEPVTLVTRLRLDAALYEPAPPYSGKGRPRKKGERLPTLQTILTDEATIWQTATVSWYGGVERTIEFVSQTAVWFHNGKPPVPLRWVLVRDPLGELEPMAVLCTDPQASPIQIVEWFVMRWPVEVTFQEARAHLGVETQRQWSDLAIARTTPALFGLFSWVTLLAHTLVSRQAVSTRSSAWYSKSLPTFADAIAWSRSLLWQSTFRMSSPDDDIVKVSRSFLARLTDTLCYAA